MKKLLLFFCLAPGDSFALSGRQKKEITGYVNHSNYVQFKRCFDQWLSEMSDTEFDELKEISQRMLEERKADVSCGVLSREEKRLADNNKAGLVASAATGTVGLTCAAAGSYAFISAASVSVGCMDVLAKGAAVIAGITCFAIAAPFLAFGTIWGISSYKKLKRAQSKEISTDKYLQAQEIFREFAVN